MSSREPPAPIVARLEPPANAAVMASQNESHATASATGTTSPSVAAPHSVPMTEPRHLSPRQRARLASLAECILEGAPASTESRAALVARCDARIAPLPPHRQRELGLAIDLLGSRVGVMLAIRRPSAFAALTPAQQARCFTVWGASRIPQLRSACQAVRRLVLAVHYARPEVAAAIGYAGPLQRRAPQVAWEGPLAGVHTDTEPVRRGAIVLPMVIAPSPPPSGVITAHLLDRDVHRRADAVVIGTGAGGAVTAARLAESGYEVVMLEEGGYYAKADFTEQEAELTERLYADGALRTTDDMSVALVQGSAVGGSTTVNWMIMLRTPAYVLEQWARESGVYGMTPQEMAPVFTRIEHEVHARTVPSDAHSANNRIILDGAERLGWRASSAVINADGCIRCGFCGVGCRHDAKQSTLLTYVPRALRAGATLCANAHVTRVELRERDGGAGTPPLKRVHVVVRDPRSTTVRSLTIDAPLVVVAGGAIGTPALLQRSGLGGGAVGAWLRLHPTTAIVGRYDRDIVVSTGIPLSTMSDEFIRWQGSDYGFWIECPPMHPSFAAAALPGLGAAHADCMRDFSRLGVLIGLTRDGADTQTSSGTVRVDTRGRTRIRYRLTPADVRRVRASIVASARLHLAAGATEVSTLHTTPIRMRGEADLRQLDRAPMGPNELGLFSAHVNGTCRMGTDPQTSGATPDGERHGTRGLYITDGSLLPTALGVNPQETIMAIATVLADRMAARHAGITRA